MAADFEEAKHIAQLAADEPKEPAHLLALADWHEENGRPYFAELIRQMVQKGTKPFTMSTVPLNELHYIGDESGGYIYHPTLDSERELVIENYINPEELNKEGIEGFNVVRDRQRAEYWRE